MSIDLRVKHDLESRRRAVELFDAGVGCKPAAEALSVPRETVREWQWVYRAFGSEALLSMGGKQSRYTFEQRVAAASAVVDGGMAKADAMAEFGIRSKSPLERWCRLYREGGAEALRPRPKGRPRGSRSKPRARTREQELEERCRRLEAEVAYIDDAGAVCRCWNWRDGVRTALSDDSADAFLAIECVEPERMGDCQAAIDRLAELLERYLGATVVVKTLVTRDNPRVEL